MPSQEAPIIIEPTASVDAPTDQIDSTPAIVEQAPVENNAPSTPETTTADPTPTNPSTTPPTTPAV